VVHPAAQYHLLTGGDDGHVKFWDLRKEDAPLLDFKVHSHWVWTARFNHYHDQLILTSSSDFQVGLSNAGSISSVLYAQLDEDDEDDEDGANAPTPDGLIAMYEEHEDSVYSVEWSSADPWLFASVSYDGRFILNHVPRETKFSILL
jgi:WD40 repeat protein